MHFWIIYFNYFQSNINCLVYFGILQILEEGLEIKIGALGKIQSMMDFWEVVHWLDLQDLLGHQP